MLLKLTSLSKVDCSILVGFFCYISVVVSSRLLCLAIKNKNKNPHSFKSQLRHVIFGIRIDNFHWYIGNPCQYYYLLVMFIFCIRIEIFDQYYHIHR